MLIPPTNNPAQSRPSRSPIKVPAVDAERQRPPLEDLRIYTPPPEENKDLRSDFRRKRTALKRAARRAIRSITVAGAQPKYRTAWCGHRVMRDDWGRQEVQLLLEDGRAFYRGTYRCGSVWLCPECSAQIARGRKEELSRAVIEAGRIGWAGALITYTFPHVWSDELDPMVKRFAKARAKMRGWRAWKKFTEKWQITGEIKGLEVTHGRHGWHPHAHVATFLGDAVPPGRRAEFQKDLFVMWARACLRADLPEPSEEHGVRITWFDDTADMAVSYVSKWTSIQELVGAQSKEGKVIGRNSWRLLEDAAGGDRRSQLLWLEFAAAFHGRAQLRWSKGLKEKLKTPDLFDNQLLDEGRGGENLLLTMQKDQWQVVCRAACQDFLLEVAEREGSEAVRGAVNRLLWSVPLPGGALVALLE